jgi:anti-sigma factor ChrR (cupin superfamily)
VDLNADFLQRILLHSDEIAWTPSPSPSIERRKLDRIGGEIARATSIVRYAPGSLFPVLAHGGGEEFIVLEGVFQDERGDYPAGTYVRNPPTSRHQPSSAMGCTIFVKLWQFDPDDRKSISVDTKTLAQISAPSRPGIRSAKLFEDHQETVQIETWAPGSVAEIDAPDGAELLVLEGECTESGDEMRAHSWLRVPIGGRITAVAGIHGVCVWVKLGGSRNRLPPSGHSEQQ